MTYPRAIFSEGLAIDYKWFDRWDIEPRFEFGFGMRSVARWCLLVRVDLWKAIRDSDLPVSRSPRPIRQLGIRSSPPMRGSRGILICTTCW